MDLATLSRRARKAITNPLFVFDLVFERAFTYFWTALFKVECFLRGIPVGKRPEIFGKCIIRKSPQSRIVIGNNVKIISSSWRSSTANCTNSKLRTFYPTSAIIMGDHSGMTGGAIIARSKTIRIGERCMLAPNVTIFDSDFHIIWPPERRHDTWETDIDEDVTLGENVWVGMGSIILKGVTIGKNSVVAAGSVVVSDIPPNCLAGGNPAKVLKTFE
jgi:acetyltransferase-like isoleucine patch superfamily enzyme